jgi:hypothetical protein
LPEEAARQRRRRAEDQEKEQRSREEHRRRINQLLLRVVSNKMTTLTEGAGPDPRSRDVSEAGIVFDFAPNAEMNRAVEPGVPLSLRIRP